MSCYFKDLIHFEKGIIVPQISFEKFNSLAGMDVPLNENISATTGITLNGEASKKSLLWDKNVIFSRKIKGKFYLLHRIKPNSDSCWY
jgi:hypothetical protein